MHRVYTNHKGVVYPLPINLGTINQFFQAAYSPDEAKALVNELAGEFDVKSAANLEEKGIALINDHIGVLDKAEVAVKDLDEKFEAQIVELMEARKSAEELESSN